MPQIFNHLLLGKRGDPLEPIHVHVSETPNQNATKIWITSAGKCYLCHNKTHIPERLLRDLMRVIEARSDEVIRKWTDFFGAISFYC